MLQGLNDISITTDIQQIITAEQARHYGIVPKNVADDLLSFYVDESKFNDYLKDELEALFGKNIELDKIEKPLVETAISKYYRKGSDASSVSGFSTQNVDHFLDDLITEAKALGSSDIHMELYEEKGRVRFRIDGSLVERFSIDKEDYPVLVNLIKVKADLDISEKRLPQDGRMNVTHRGDKIDLRVSCLPTLYKEKIVLRLLSNDATNIDIKKLGFADEELKKYLEGIKKPHGIMLISGPTGSGKTTTLYATLKLLNEESRNILTVEDPIEYTLDGINQVQLKESIGLNFASALKSFLRQDPDIIMLGEIRDGETAQMAIRAALTGHLVLSTIHTNSAWGTVSRLIDMGVAPYLLASTLNSSVAQRLLRLLCPECKTKEEVNLHEIPSTYKKQAIKEHYVAKGCDTCHYTGYKGRKAIYEVIPFDEELMEEVKKNNHNIKEYLKRKNIRTLAENAWVLYVDGQTSLEEVYPILINH